MKLIKLETLNQCLIVLFFVMFIPSFAKPKPDKPVPPTPSKLVKAPQEDPDAIEINTDLVVVHASVQNDKKAFISGLEKENFQVFEDGILQQIDTFHHEDVSVTVGLVVDNSGSMRTRRTEVIAAGLAFARSSNPRDQIFVVNFNERVSFGLPPDTPFTDNVVKLETALSKNVTNGMTALYDGLAVAFEHLKKGNREKQVLIAISDGGDNASTHTLAHILALAGKSEVIIYTISIYDESDKDRNAKVLKELARATGGEAFLAKSVKEALPICERIARDIRNQYSLTYAPTNLKYDGTYRAIQVKVNVPGNEHLSVRTRAGYSAPLKP
ncbi:MAG: VWA domain-containing protein [Acidobacteria bacterium]|nr:VWA domain-containing protein [Acidobacteriota bacterium]